MNRVRATAITVGWTAMRQPWQAGSLCVTPRVGNVWFPLLPAIHLAGPDSSWQAATRREEIEMAGRLCVPVDAYMLLERDGKVLMLRRAAEASYAAGLLCPPSGHVETDETVSDAAIRETAEETGIKLRPDQVRCVTVVHHRGPGGQARIGWFFAAELGWTGEPVNLEPAKHAGLAWIDPAEPPGDLVAYTWAGLCAWQAGAPHAIHFQEPGSPVRYEPGYEGELSLLRPVRRPF
jgi:8-oxo-dGTP pyrophosphatase MutT (NUDIX family)